MTRARPPRDLLASRAKAIATRTRSKPTTATYDCRPYLNGNNETCSFTNPAATDYYVMLRGYQSYSGVTLVGHYP